MNYQEMFHKFQHGQISSNQWVAFCRDYFNNVIMTDPVVIEVMTRLRDR